MRRCLLSAAVVCLALLAGAQQAAAPAAAPIPTPAELNQAIEDFARQLPAGITADRYAAFAVEMPADEAEYKALNKHALLVVGALSKDASELPLQRVYLEQESTLELPLLASVARELPAESAAGKLMGTHRVDAYYLIPLSAWRTPGTLLADFAAHRKEFILGKFPQEIKEEFIRNDAKPEPRSHHSVKIEAQIAILERAITGPVPMRIWVSAGMAAGLLTRSVPPHYPEAAKASRVEGTVVMQVVIGKDGVVQEVRVVSGDSSFAPAAVDAVKRWRYRPYLLNGQPVEMETQVSIVFTLMGG